jgi:hypothetical protein
VGTVNLASAWTLVRHGVTPTNRREVEDAAYLLNYEGTPLRVIADELHLDRFAARALIEAGADRAWRNDWTDYDRSQNPIGARMVGPEAVSSTTSAGGPQDAPVRPLGGRQPHKKPTGTTYPGPECEGCKRPLVGKRRDAKFCDHRCRMRAKRRAATSRSSRANREGGTVR